MTKGKSRLLVVGVILGIIFGGGAFILWFQMPSGPADRPWLNPPAGQNDLCYSNATTLYGGNTIAGRLLDSIAVVRFETNGEPILLYGSYNSPDGAIDFFIIDDDGYNTMMAFAWLNPVDIHTNFTASSREWQYYLEPELEGDSVANWYVVYSAYHVGILDSRSINALTCQDRTGPDISLSIDDIVNGTVAIEFTVTETRCNITSIFLYVNETIVADWYPNNNSCSPIYNWDTTFYPNGTYWIGVVAEDSMGNRNASWELTTVNNTVESQSLEIPREIAFNLTVIVSVFLILSLIGIICQNNTKKAYIGVSVIVMIIAILVFQLPDFQPGVHIEWGISFASIISIGLALYGLYYGRVQSKKTGVKFADLKKGQKRIETTIETQAKKGRDHTTRKTTEIKKKLEDEG